MDRPSGSDKELLADFVASKDEAAFEHLVLRHGRMVLNVCQRVINNRQIAEDATQAVFLTLAEKASSLRRRETIAGWLHQVAWHIASRAREAELLRKVHEQEASGRKGVMEEDGAWKQLRPHLDEELYKLPERLRLPLVLHYLEGRGEEEGAALLGWKRGTFSSRLSRGREALRRSFARRGIPVSRSALAALLPWESVAPEALPQVFEALTAKAAIQVAIGSPSLAGLVSIPVLALKQGALRTLLIAKVKAAIVASIAVVALTGAFGVSLFHLQAAKAGEARLAAVEIGKESPKFSVAAETNDKPSVGAPAKLAVEVTGDKTQVPPISTPQPAPGWDPKVLEDLKADLQRKAPGGRFEVEEIRPWIFVSDLPAAPFKKIIGQVTRVSGALKRQLFTKYDPSRPVIVYFFKNSPSYRKWFQVLFDKDPNPASGGVGEMVGEPGAGAPYSILASHVETGYWRAMGLMAGAQATADFPEIPSWLRDGLAGLYHFGALRADGRFVSLPDLNLRFLKANLETGILNLKELFLRSPEGGEYWTHMALDSVTARYLLHWLQDQGKLEAFYWRLREQQDRDAIASLLKVFEGRFTLGQIQEELRGWVLNLDPKTYRPPAANPGKQPPTGRGEQEF